MDRSRALLLTLWCVWISNISGAEVKKRVRRGDNITLYCDCAVPQRSHLAWFRNCSDDSHPPLLLTSSPDVKQHFPRFRFVRNSSSKTYDLLVENISEKDLGVYYCARQEIQGNSDGTVYHYGNQTTRISLIDMTIPCTSPSQTTSTPPISDRNICWKLLVSVTPVCVLFSSLISSTCVYCICRARTTGQRADQGRSVKMRKQDEAGGEDEVCYASLDLPSRGQKHLKKKKTRVESSDFSTYSEVKSEKV